jgi:hypothetical protein
LLSIENTPHRIALFVLTRASALFHYFSIDLKPLLNLTGRSSDNWESLFDVSEIVALIFRKHKSDVYEMEVIEVATFNSIRCKTILGFVLLLKIFGDFERDT